MCDGFVPLISSLLLHSPHPVKDDNQVFDDTDVEQDRGFKLASYFEDTLKYRPFKIKIPTKFYGEGFLDTALAFHRLNREPKMIQNNIRLILIGLSRKIVDNAKSAHNSIQYADDHIIMLSPTLEKIKNTDDGYILSNNPKVTDFFQTEGEYLDQVLKDQHNYIYENCETLNYMEPN